LGKKITQRNPQCLKIPPCAKMPHDFTPCLSPKNSPHPRWRGGNQKNMMPWGLDQRFRPTQFLTNGGVTFHFPPTALPPPEPNHQKCPSLCGGAGAGCPLLRPPPRRSRSTSVKSYSAGLLGPPAGRAVSQGPSRRERRGRADRWWGLAGGLKMDVRASYNRRRLVQ